MSPHHEINDDDGEDEEQVLSADGKHPKIFSKKRREGQVTSRLGNLLS